MSKVSSKAAVSKPSSSYRTTAKSDSNGLVKASIATVIPTDANAAQDLDHRSVHLRPINSEAHNDATEDASDLIGTKRVSQTSIENIRNGGNHVRISFDDIKKTNSHLPASKALPPKQVKYSF